MQMASVEFARNVVGLDGADSTEFEDAPKHRVIFKLRELVDVEELGGTMRLGAYPCVLNAGSRAASPTTARPSASATGTATSSTRPSSRKPMEDKGLAFTGMSPDGTFVEIVELPDHPYFLGCSSTRNSSPSPCSPTRCSRPSSRPARRTGASGLSGHPGSPAGPGFPDGGRCTPLSCSGRPRRPTWVPVDAPTHRCSVGNRRPRQQSWLRRRFLPRGPSPQGHRAHVHGAPHLLDASCT